MAVPLSTCLDLLRKAALDGHTWVPLTVIEAARATWEDDVSAGLVVAVSVDGVNGLALDDIATAEDAVADEVLGLAEDGRLAVAYGAPRSDEAVVVTGVQRLSLEEVAAALQAVADGAPVVLAGDPHALPGPAPGNVLRDVVAAAVVPVHDVRDGITGAIGAVLAGLRRGELVAPDPSDRGVVVVACADDAEVAHRVGQLVGTSVPRAFDLKPADIVVLSPLHRGVAGVTALAELLPESEVMTVHEVAAAGRTWPAVILCLPGEAAGVLSRGLVVSAFLAAERHVSVVTAVGPDLDIAVAQVAQRPVRRTRLASLLRDGAALA